MWLFNTFVTHTFCEPHTTVVPLSTVCNVSFVNNVTRDAAIFSTNSFGSTRFVTYVLLRKGPRHAAFSWFTIYYTTTLRFILPFLGSHRARNVRIFSRVLGISYVDINPVAHFREKSESSDTRITFSFQFQKWEALGEGL